MARPIDHARQLAGWGLNVLPAKVGGHHPQVEWKRYQTERVEPKLDVYFAGDSPRDYWVATGVISQCVVLDCDNAEAESYWRERLGDLLDETVAVKTRRGTHFYFRLTEPMRSWSVHPTDGETGPSFDVRADKTGVIVPPSAGKTWLRSPDEYSMEPVPEALKKPGGEDAGAHNGVAGRSMLTQLLTDPGKGGYNNWFTRVCGHYAKEYSTRRDAYEYHCWEAYNKLPGEPHPKKDAEKTLESVWAAEQAKVESHLPGPDNGYLQSGGTTILTLCRYKDGDEVRLEVEEWADFDLVAHGVVEDADAARTYDVSVRRDRQKDERRGLLPARVLADSRQLNAWLAEFGVTIAPPDAQHPRGPASTVRLQRYLEAQKPPHFQVVEHLGWHSDGFVVHEGVIRRDGLHPHADRRPHPRLSNWAPYHYGFRPVEETRAVLRELLTFHDETVTSVFGAWWAACLLKPQIHRVASQFPFMALEAPSESGKTTGFFAMMLSLAGNTQGNVNPTRAALRDYMSAHQSGIVWIDDLDDTTHLMELLRQATGEGSVAKKGEDRDVNQSVQLVAPISISGEALSLSGQKALVDRAVQLQVGSPTSRKSLNDPRVPQWHDIVRFKERYPDLTEFSGTIVQMALAHEAMVEGIPALAPPQGGRFGDKIAILRFGAGLLAALTGDEEHIDRVEAWCGRAEDVGSENALTLKVLPTALRQTGWLSRPRPGDGRWPFTPVVVDENDIVWFSVGALGTWWDSFRNGRVELRTESPEALEQQARALGLPAERKRIQLFQDKNQKPHFWALPAELSRMVIDRSQGVADSRGVHPEEIKLALQIFLDPSHGEAPTE